MSSSPKSPSWRWDAAKSAIESTCFCPTDDRAMLAARRFLNRWASCRSAFDLDLLATQMPNVFGAFTIYDDEGVARHALEARILANESVHRIAAKTGFSSQVLQTYEDVFFDVRNRLTQVDFILYQVIDQEFRGSQDRTPYFVCWKIFGYVGGEAVLDSLMNSAPIARHPTNPDEVDAFLNQETQRSLRQKMAQAAQMLDPGSREQFQSIIMAMHQLVEERKENDGNRLDHLTTHVKAMLAEIPWATGREAEKTLDPTLLGYDELAAELRDDELQQLGTGGKVPSLEELKNLKMPLPKPKKAHLADLE